MSGLFYYMEARDCVNQVNFELTILRQEFLVFPCGIRGGGLTVGQ
jgi:hypothetical protein